MRKKTVEFEGASYTISPLNLDQVEEFAKDTAATISADVLAMDAASPALKVIRTSLNNARPETPWTEKLLREELDLPALKFLFKEILAYSGLGTAPVLANAN